jgi:hypothetical protein
MMWQGLHKFIGMWQQMNLRENINHTVSSFNLFFFNQNRPQHCPPPLLLPCATPSPPAPAAASSALSAASAPTAPPAALDPAPRRKEVEGGEKEKLRKKSMFVLNEKLNVSYELQFE